MRPDVPETRAEPPMMWLTPFIHVPVPEDGAELRYSQEAADQVLDFFGLLVFGQKNGLLYPARIQLAVQQTILHTFGEKIKQYFFQFSCIDGTPKCRKSHMESGNDP